MKNTPQILKRHPLSAAFPDMPEDEFAALVEDIRQNGLLQPVVTHDGMVLDGWHRYRASIEAGVEPAFDEFDGADPVAFVLSLNMHRRHLNATQRSAAVVACRSWAQSGDNQHTQGGGEAAAPPRATVKQMADEAGASERTIQQVKKAHEAGLGEAMRDGKVSAEKAAAIAKLPEPERQAALEAPPAPKARPLEPNFGAHRIAELEAALAERDAKIRELEAANAAMLEQLEIAQADLEAAQRILDVPEDERGGQTFKELQRANALNVALQTRNNGLMGHNAGLAKDLKRLNAKCERLQKSLDGFREPEAEPPAENPYFDPEAGPDPLIDGLGA